MAASKRRHPARYAAEILAAAWSGRAWRWTPRSIDCPLADWLLTTAATTSSTSCGRGKADGIGKRDGFDAGVGEQIAGGDDLIDAPRVAIGIAECHRDVSNDIEAGLVGEGTDGLERVDGFFGGLVLIAFEEARGDGIGKAERVDATAIDGALRALDVDDDTDDFELVSCGGRRHERGQVGEGEDLFGVGHLRDGFGGDEGDGVDVAEAGGDQGAEVFGFHLGGDGEGQALPCVAGALDDFDGRRCRNGVIGHSRVSKGGRRAIAPLAVGIYLQWPLA